MRGLISVGLLLVVGLVFLPALVCSADDEGIGEYVREANIHGSGPKIPLGHYGMIAKYADMFLSIDPDTGKSGGHRTIYAETLMDGKDEPKMADELGEFFLLDIRDTVDYCKGHIKGAINVPFADVAKPENLAVLPIDKPILVICYTGHTASVVTGILNVLGYDSWTLRFGMTSWWQSSSTKIWSPNRSQTIYGGGYDKKYGLEVCQ